MTQEVKSGMGYMRGEIWEERDGEYRPKKEVVDDLWTWLLVTVSVPVGFCILLVILILTSG